MARFDRVLIDPDQQELETALHEAVRTANGDRDQRVVPWPLPGALDVVAQREGTAAGGHQWNGGPGIGEARSVVVLAWWSDVVGRKHHRVFGRSDPFSRPLFDNLLCPFGEPRPSLWFIYPEFVFLKREGGRREAIALCACGAYGTPQQLGWMGTCCDGCHDRREEGIETPPAWLDPYRATLRGQEGRLVFLACSPDSRYLAAGSGREEVTIWDTATGDARAVLKGPSGEWLLCADWSPDGQTVMTGSASGNLIRWDPATGQRLGSFGTGGGADCCTLSPAAGLVARADRQKASLWTLQGRPRRDLDSLDGTVSLAFSPNGQLLAGGNRYGNVSVWDVQRGEMRTRVQGLSGTVASLAFAPDGQTLAIGLLPDAAPDEPAPIVLYDLAFGRVRSTLPGHERGVRCATFAPDGRLLATGGDDGALKLWDVSTGRERVTLEWHLDSVCSAVFTPDGLTLATGSFDGSAKLWPREVLRPLERRGERSVLVR